MSSHGIEETPEASENGSKSKQSRPSTSSDSYERGTSVFSNVSEDVATENVEQIIYLKSVLKKEHAEGISITPGDSKIVLEKAIPKPILNTVNKDAIKSPEVIFTQDIVDVVTEGVFAKVEDKILSRSTETSSLDIVSPKKKSVKISNADYLIGPTPEFQYDEIGLGERFFAAMMVYNDEIHEIDVNTSEEQSKGEILDKSIKLAAKMKSLGMTPDDIIVVCSTSHTGQSIVVLGTMLIGAILAPIDPEMTIDECSKLIEILDPRMVFCDPRTKGQMESALVNNNIERCDVIIFNTDKPHYNSIEKFISQYEFEEFTVAKIDNPRKKTAFILPTTGTTGPPKLCALSHYAMTCRINIWKTKILKGCRKLMSWFPLSWFMQLTIHCSCYEMPITRVIQNHFSERSACKAIYECQVDRVVLGTMYALMLSKHVARIDYDMGCLRAIVIGGATTTPSRICNIWNGFHYVRIYQCYGCTECGIVSLHCINDSIRMQKKAASSGLVLEGCKIKVVDFNTNEHLLPNEIGLIWVKSEGMMMGYYKQPELTATVIDDEGFFSTGDAGTYSACDHIYIKGRKTDIFFKNDMVLTTLEVDEFLIRHPNVEDCVTVSNGSILISYVIKKPGKVITSAEIYYLLEKYSFPEYLTPHKITFLEMFPKTSIGKVRKYKLTEVVYGLKKSVSQESFT